MDEITQHDYPSPSSPIGKIYGREKYKMSQYGLTEYHSMPSIRSYESLRVGQERRDLKSLEHGRKVWYLGETIKKLYDLDQNPGRKLFLDEYFTFMKARGATVSKVPVVAKLPLDLFRLYHVVQKLGGFAQVVKKRRWSRVVRELDLPSSITSAAFTLRTQYMRLLYPYECEKKGIPSNFLYYEDEVGWNPESSNLSEHRYDVNSRPPKLLREDKHSSYQKEARYHSKPESSYVELSSQSEDNIRSKLREEIGYKRKCESPASPATKRAKSEELDRDIYEASDVQVTRPQSFDNTLLSNRSINYNVIEGKRRYSDGDPVKRERVTPTEERPTEEDIVRESEREILEKENFQKEERYQYKRMILSEEDRNYKDFVYPSFTYPEKHSNSHPRDCRDCIVSQSSPEPMRVQSVLEDTRVKSHMLPRQPHNGEYYPDSRARSHLSRSLDERRFSGERSMYKRRFVNYYRPSVKNVRLSTNPSEMNITIEERTETAMALSIVVNGIKYTGTLLSNIQRT